MEEIKYLHSIQKAMADAVNDLTTLFLSIEPALTQIPQRVYPRASLPS